MVKVHFDIEGSVEECQAVLAQLGFPISTSMTEAEQAVVAAALESDAAQVKDAREKLQRLSGDSK